MKRKKRRLQIVAPGISDPLKSNVVDDEGHQKRINVLLIVILCASAIMLVRLWSMQVINAGKYAKLSDANRLTELPVPANRGLIYDRRGRILVDNRPSIVVTGNRDIMTSDANVKKWSKLLKRKPGDIMDSILSSRIQNPRGRPVLAVDLDDKAVARLREAQRDYPELRASLESVRDYPYGKLGSHLIGYIGHISDEQLSDKKYSGYIAGDLVGKGGIELTYESILGGVKGTQMLEVDARGAPVRKVHEIPPAAGHSIALTIDRRIQASAERALIKATKLARKQGFPKAKEGAAVVLNAKTGEILALASYPSYDPSVFIGGISQKKWSKLNRKSSHFPLINRAVVSVYPPGSTFKPFVALAALGTNLVSPGYAIRCGGSYKASDKWKKAYRDWTPAGHGNVGIVDGLKDSCDVLFYNLGYRFYQDGGDKMQKYVRKYGFGSKTGVDLPFEAVGRVPDPKWKRDFNKEHPEYAPWLPGDSINISIGQGDLLVSPLQLAVAYGALANNGKLMRPHMVSKIFGVDGRVIKKIDPTEVRGLSDIERYQMVNQGLRQVVLDGTAKDVFRGFPIGISGKTGTAQVLNKDDFALFAAYGPVEDPEYVVVVIIEQGGHGGSVAAPAVRSIYSTIFNVEEKTGLPKVSEDEDLVIVNDNSR